MTLTELKYIVAVARERHFGKAAEACYVSQPTLSVAVKKLEEELDVKLFERSANEVTVTPLGEEIVRQAQSVLEQAANIKDIAKRGKDPLAGSLKLGVIYTIAPYLLPDLVRQVIKRTPQMPLMLQENFTVKLLEMLRTGEIDCAILAEPFPDAGLASAPLYDEPFLAAVPMPHALASQTSVTTEQLKKKPCCCWATGIASGTMCWRSAPSSPASPATPKASARVLKARPWRPSNTWLPRAWASPWCRA
jgi:LysR family hydrogen peroxide-inducible transcriptional activator